LEEVIIDHKHHVETNLDANLITLSIW